MHLFRLIDTDGQDVREGDPGDVAVRGPTLFSGYWNADETNARDFRDGWFHMGDVFAARSDGRYQYVDRIKHLIKTGAENVRASCSPSPHSSQPARPVAGRVNAATPRQSRSQAASRRVPIARRRLVPWRRASRARRGQQVGPSSALAAPAFEARPGCVDHGSRSEDHALELQ